MYRCWFNAVADEIEFNSRIQEGFSLISIGFHANSNNYSICRNRIFVTIFIYDDDSIWRHLRASCTGQICGIFIQMFYQWNAMRKACILGDDILHFDDGDFFAFIHGKVERGFAANLPTADNNNVFTNLIFVIRVRCQNTTVNPFNRRNDRGSTNSSNDSIHSKCFYLIWCCFEIVNDRNFVLFNLVNEIVLIEFQLDLKCYLICKYQCTTKLIRLFIDCYIMTTTFKVQRSFHTTRSATNHSHFLFHKYRWFNFIFMTNNRIDCTGKPMGRCRESKYAVGIGSPYGAI